MHPRKYMNPLAEYHRWYSIQRTPLIARQGWNPALLWKYNQATYLLWASFLSVGAGGDAGDDIRMKWINMLEVSGVAPSKYTVSARQM